MQFKAIKATMSAQVLDMDLFRELPIELQRKILVDHTTFEQKRILSETNKAYNAMMPQPKKAISFISTQFAAFMVLLMETGWMEVRGKNGTSTIYVEPILDCSLIPPIEEVILEGRLVGFHLNCSDAEAVDAHYDDVGPKFAAMVTTIASIFRAKVVVTGNRNIKLYSIEAPIHRDLDVCIALTLIDDETNKKKKLISHIRGNRD